MGMINNSGNWFSLSHSQEALWFLWRLVPEGYAFNTVVPVRVHGDLEVPALARSVSQLSRRHPCLRCEFTEEAGRPRQRTRADHLMSLIEVDASLWTQSQIDSAMAEEARRPFNLETNAVPRITLFKRSRCVHELIIVLHHINSDLWSTTVMLDELRQIYQAEKMGKYCSLPQQSYGFEDYVHHHRELLEDPGERERLWHYWRQELSGELPVLDLPADCPRPAVLSYQGGTIVRRMDVSLTNNLKQLARSQGVTLFMTLLAAYQVILQRFTGQNDLIVGIPTSGRHRPELANVIGDFVNMVPIRVALHENTNFLELLKQNREKVIGAIKYQDYPLSLMVDHLGLARDLSRNPIFQTSFSLQSVHRFEELSRLLMPADDEPFIPFADLELEPLPLSQQEGQYDLNLEMKVDEANRLVGSWKYSKDLFRPEAVERIATHFEVLLSSIVAGPHQNISELPLLNGILERQLLLKGMGGQIPMPEESTIVMLFKEQTKLYGEKMALRCSDSAISYANLEQRVSNLAGNLIEMGIGCGKVVALLLPRGIDFVTAMLGVMEAGAAFLPLDWRHPTSRILQILESSSPSLLLTVRALEEITKTPLASIDEVWRPKVITMENLVHKPMPIEYPDVDAADLAYMMYTSGSTGRPKGVLVEHRGMVNHILGKISDLGLGPDDTLAQNGPPTFDIVVWQCLAPLVVGGCAQILPDEVAEEPARLISEVQSRGISILQLVPSMMQAVIETLKDWIDGESPLSSLRWIVPTGDALPTELCRRWLELYPSIPILNTYGSTECSDDQCHYKLFSLLTEDEAVSIVSVGTPIRNLSAHVLDDNLAPVPIGVAGELYIGGIGVGRGYHDDPRRTAESFLPDPFSQIPGARMYRTRDKARRRLDGNIDFLSRVDQMIKIRGLRIERGEIEAALQLHPAISQAAVVARKHPSGEQRLVAYVALNYSSGDDNDHSQPSSHELIRFLSTNLPQNMLPSMIEFIPSLPLSGNGKVDLSQLPEPEWGNYSSKQMVFPRTPTEKLIASVWTEVLGVEQISITDNFFEIGGDSIRSIQIVSRCKRLGINLRPADLFTHPTITDLAAHVPSSATVEPAEETIKVAELHVSQESLEMALGQVQFDAE